MKLREMQEQRSGKIAEMREISEKAANDNRDLSGEERKRFDALDGEVRGLNARLPMWPARAVRCFTPSWTLTWWCATPKASDTRRSTDGDAGGGQGSSADHGA